MHHSSVLYTKGIAFRGFPLDTFMVSRQISEGLQKIFALILKLLLVVYIYMMYYNYIQILDKCSAKGKAYEIQNKQ